MLTLSTPRLDLGNQVPPVGLAVIRLEIRIEDVQTALVYAGKGQIMAAAVSARDFAPDVVARGKARNGQRQIAPEFRRGFQLMLRVLVVAEILVHRAGAERVSVFSPRICRNAAQALLRHYV